MGVARFGLDIGGTKIAGVVVDDPSGTVTAVDRVETPATGADLVAAMHGLIGSLADRSGTDPLSVGVGIAGLIDADGVMRYGPNLPGVIDLDVAGELSPLTGTPVLVDNDATCGALAEHAVGAARGIDQAVVVALGTGIGGGVVLDGRLRRGAHRMAGEIGHLLVDPAGPLCGCGQRGCWEQFASGNALGRQARDAARAGRADALVAAVGGRIDDVAGEHVAAAAADGDPGALQVLDGFARWVAVGLSGLVNILDPEIIVIGGGLVEMGDLLLDPVRHHLDGLCVGAGHRPVVPVVPAVLGEHAAAIGAALLGAEAGRDG
ncbi:MAG: ROK family protein [Acidimicrobiales bacterium]